MVAAPTRQAYDELRRAYKAQRLQNATMMAQNAALTAEAGRLADLVAKSNDTQVERAADLLGIVDGEQSSSLVQVGLKLNALYSIDRNNIFDGTGSRKGHTGVYVSKYGLEPPPLGNRVCSNTIYKREHGPNSTVGINVDATAKDTVIANSLVSFPSIDHGVLMLESSSNAQTLNNKMRKARNFVAPDASDPLKRDFSVSAPSPAIGKGAPIPVFDDFNGAPRNHAKPTVGALR